LRRHYFHTVPFRLQEPWEVELLGWLLAIPRSKQAWAVKQALRLTLREVAVSHFGIAQPADVNQALATRASASASRRRARQAQPAMAPQRPGAEPVAADQSGPAQTPLSTPSTPQAPGTPPAERAQARPSVPVTESPTPGDKALAEAIVTRLSRLAR